MSVEQRLRDRVEELEFMLGLDRDLAMRIRHAWHLPPEESRVLAVIIKRSFATRDALYTILYGGRPDCDQPEMKIIDVYVCKLRKALKRVGLPQQIATKWGDGYFMTRDDKVSFMAALVEAETLPTAVPKIAADELPAFLPNRAA